MAHGDDYFVSGTIIQFEDLEMEQLKNVFINTEMRLNIAIGENKFLRELLLAQAKENNHVM